MAHVDSNLTNPENYSGVPASLHFKYQFPHNFTTVADGFLKKYNWEPRTQITTVSSIKQLDEDRIMFYRRKEGINFFGTTWEQVTINRVTQEIESRVISPHADKLTFSTVERTVYKPSATEGKADVDTEIFDVQGNGSIKVEVFKN